MNIGQLIAERGKPFYSFEFFPPKDPDQWPDFFKMAERLAPLEPLFTSVTYGAGGSSQDATLEIVSHLKKEFQFETMAHLTCVGATQDYITQYLQRLRDNGVDNVLALRGDRTARGKGVASVPSPVANIAELLHSDETTEAFLERFGALLLQYYGLSGYSPISPNETERIAQIERIRRMKQQADNHGE